MTGRVIHTGQAIVDIAMEVEAVPAPGGDTFTDRWSLQPGGGFNVMAAARREGSAVLYTGGHGTGPFGDLVRAAMTTEGVEILAPVTTGIDTGFCVALIDQQAERTFVSTVGAEGSVDRHALATVLVEEGDVVYVSGYSLYHDVKAQLLLQWLHTLPPAVHVVIDSSPMLSAVPHDVLDAALKAATLWTLNETEAQALLGRLEGEEGRPPTADEVCRRLRAVTSGAVVVRTGAQGCWVAADNPHPTRVPSLPVVAVDTNGAGDAHAGVLCAGLTRGEPVLDVLRRANAAAAIAVTRRGPATAPLRHETDQALSSAGEATEIA